MHSRGTVSGQFKKSARIRWFSPVNDRCAARSLNTLSTITGSEIFPVGSANQTPGVMNGIGRVRSIVEDESSLFQQIFGYGLIGW